TCSTSAYTAFRRCYLGCVCTFLTLYLRIPSFLFVLPPRPPPSTLFPYTTLFRSYPVRLGEQLLPPQVNQESNVVHAAGCPRHRRPARGGDRRTAGRGRGASACVCGHLR